MSHLAHEKTVLPQGTDNQSQKGEKEDTVEKPTSKDPHMEVLRPYPQLVVVKLTTPHRQTAMSTMLGGRSIIGPFVNEDADEEIRMISGRLVIMPEDDPEDIGSFELTTQSSGHNSPTILAGTSYLLAAPFGAAEFHSTFTEPKDEDGEDEAEGGEDKDADSEDGDGDGEDEATDNKDGDEDAGDEDEATPPAEMLPPPESVSTVREPIFPRSPIGGAIVKSTKLPPSDTKPNE